MRIGHPMPPLDQSQDEVSLPRTAYQGSPLPLQADFHEQTDDQASAPFPCREAFREAVGASALYAYCVGVPSSRRIEKASTEDLAFRVLSGNQQPDHIRISEFRRRHLSQLEGLFVQVLKLCQVAGLLKLGYGALVAPGFCEAVGRMAGKLRSKKGRKMDAQR